MTLTPKELEILKRCEQATPGPWEVDRDTPLSQTIMGIYSPWAEQYTALLEDQDDAEYPAKEEDCAFIAHAREDIPTLLSTVSALREEIERLTKQRDQATGRMVFSPGGQSIYCESPGEYAYVGEASDLPELAEVLRKRSEAGQAEQSATQPASTNQEGVSPGAKQL